MPETKNLVARPDGTVAAKRRRSLGEVANDLTVSGSAHRDVEIVDVDPDLAVDLARDGVENAVGGVQQPDLGPGGGSGAACDYANMGANA